MITQKELKESQILQFILLNYCYILINILGKHSDGVTTFHCSEHCEDVLEI